MARKTNPRPQKIVQHKCVTCELKSEPAILRRAQDRKCPKCEYWGVKMMIPYVLAYEVTQTGEVSHFIRSNPPSFNALASLDYPKPGRFSDTVKVHADVEAYFLWWKNTGREA